jgi:DEAD/DEAH box helicase domain-containing protein
LPRHELESGLLGLAYVLGQVAPLFLMCDSHDVAVWPEVRSVFTGAPTIYMYDRVPGGIGFSKRLYNVHQQLLGSAGGVVTRCPCEHGCPSCVGPMFSTERNAKLASIRLVSILLDEIRLPTRTREIAPR